MGYIVPPMPTVLQLIGDDSLIATLEPDDAYVHSKPVSIAFYGLCWCAYCRTPKEKVHAQCVNCGSYEVNVVQPMIAQPPRLPSKPRPMPTPIVTTEWR